MFRTQNFRTDSSWIFKSDQFLPGLVVTASLAGENSARRLCLTKVSTPLEPVSSYHGKEGQQITERRLKSRERMGGFLQMPYEMSVKIMLGSLERNLLPDPVIRRLTRLLLASRLRSGYKPTSELQLSELLNFIHCNSFLYLSEKKKECYITYAFFNNYW